MGQDVNFIVILISILGLLTRLTTLNKPRNEKFLFTKNLKYQSNYRVKFGNKI